MKVLIAILVLTSIYSPYTPAGGINDQQMLSKSIPFDDTYERVVMNKDQNPKEEEPDQKDDRLIVKYDVKDGDIYVECFVKDFIFSKDKAGSLKEDGQGHVHLYINGNKVDSIFTSSFIIKSLPIGTYKIKVELVHNDYSSYDIYEEFEVKL